MIHDIILSTFSKILLILTDKPLKIKYKTLFYRNILLILYNVYGCFSVDDFLIVCLQLYIYMLQGFQCLHT